MRRSLPDRRLRDLRPDPVKGFLQRLGEIAGRDPDAARWAQALVAELEQEDAERCSGLVATLRAYYASNARVDKTAEVLFLHRNSVRYRLDRIRLLTGLDIDRPDVVAAMTVALGCRATITEERIDAG
ncbi:MAG: helix-turn-helix domain-containing protein [Candidatus Eremiobacteraeota bacterium]|nr:helix-turn-helix domain-containing protein [Candidatus Eremiobacteraeota bacterium]